MKSIFRKVIKWSNDNQGWIGFIGLVAIVLFALFTVWWAAGAVAALLVISFLISRESVSNPAQTAHTVARTPDKPRDTKPALEQHSQGKETDTIPPQKIMVNVTPEYLAGLFNNQTSIQAQKLIATFIGKWMKVSGPMDDVDSFDLFSSVSFAPGAFGGVFVSMFFRNKQYVEDRLSVLKKGDQMTVLGQIVEVSRLWVKLDNCELVDADE